MSTDSENRTDAERPVELPVSWPKDGTRYLCNSVHPMPKGAPGQWAHADAEIIDEDYGGLSGGGDYDRCRCKNCGVEWWSQLPD
ncbi:MAG TPA: hypothetical protein VIQ81_03960 [Gammaproteobacteria bacterium]